MYNHTASRQSCTAVHIIFTAAFKNLCVWKFIANPFRKVVSVMPFIFHKTVNMTFPADDTTQNFLGFWPIFLARSIFSFKRCTHNFYMWHFSEINQSVNHSGLARPCMCWNTSALFHVEFQIIMTQLWTASAHIFIATSRLSKVT